MKFTVAPRKKGKGFDLVSDALSHGKLWYRQVTDAVSYAIHRAGSATAKIELLDRDGKVVSTINHDPRDPEHGGRLGKI